MKIAGIIGMILLVSMLFLSIGILITDFETNYIDTNISSASPINQSLKESMVNESQINETFDPLQKQVEDLQSQDGFLDVVGDGTVVLPTIFISFTVSILKLVGLSQQQTISILEYIGLPIMLISFVSVAIIVFFVVKIIEQLRRYPV